MTMGPSQSGQPLEQDVVHKILTLGQEAKPDSNLNQNVQKP
jgi:hypothetical protein